MRRDLKHAEAALSQPSATSSNQTRSHSKEKPNTLEAYLRLALRDSPKIQARFAEWRGAIHSVAGTRQIPEPQISFTYFIKSIETRTGPQLARFRFRQTLPWPAELNAQTSVESEKALAAHRALEAEILSVAYRVRRAYWMLLESRILGTIHQEHLNLVQALSESARARLATGSASLADLQQIDLTAARVEDKILEMAELSLQAQARLRAAVGSEDLEGFELSTPNLHLQPGVPKDSREQLRTWLASNPRHRRLTHLERSFHAREQVHKSRRFPKIGFGADWTIIQPTRIAGQNTSGEDAIALMANLHLPMWQKKYGERIRLAKAQSRAQLARSRELLVEEKEELNATLSQVKNNARQIRLYSTSLVPQAESVYESVLGGYTVGKGSVAQALLAQHDLLQLRIELEQSRAQYARNWARLEMLVGRSLNVRPLDGGRTGPFDARSRIKQ